MVALALAVAGVDLRAAVGPEHHRPLQPNHAALREAFAAIQAAEFERVLRPILK